MTRHRFDQQGMPRHMRAWKRQPVDLRDYQFKPAVAKVPAVVSLRGKMPAVRDQGELGSCTANAGVVATEFCLAKQTGKAAAQLSRLDLYASTRELEGTPLEEDSGCYVRSVFKASNKFGICNESLWPYDVEKFDRNPPRTIILESLHKKATSYYAVTGIDKIKACLAEGFPIIFGFDCYESMFMPAVEKTGIIPMPVAHDAPAGGHCVAAIGYSDAKQMIEIQNSWGTGWGDKGHGWLPYGYVSHGLATDFWTLRSETVS